MEVEDRITINKAFASKYEKKKRTEELSKLRDKYGDMAVDEPESSSSDEEEDENAELLTATVEKDFLRTLSLIRSKDPRIYDKDSQFYQKNAGKPEGAEEKVEKPMYLKDYERQQLLKRGAMAGVSDSEEEDKEHLPFSTYLEEQEQLKTDFHQAVSEDRLGEREDGSSLLTLREKTQEEREEEERDYILWLKGERAKMAAGESDFSGLHSVWTAPDLDPDEAFLRDYILNRAFIDRDTVSAKVPTYHEIVGDSEDSEEEEKLQKNKMKKVVGEGTGGEEGGGEEGGEEGETEEEEEEEVDVSEDEESLNRQEDFERKYNFRFEEPGGDLITTYPRTVSGSVRREEDRRKEKRKEREERKGREREQKEEELKRLKKLKRKEIKQKLEKIKDITGNPNVGFSAAHLEGDFDPASYDEVMAQAFDDDYYTMEGGGEGEEDEEKPVFSDDDEDYEDWDQLQVDQEPHCEDPSFNMDADYDPQTSAEEPSSTKKASKSASLKRRHKLAQAVAEKKPLFDPAEKSFEEYFDEYYHLDYEDIIGDMPCRFKYRQVPANTFGLSVEEVLACEDKELNQWVSLKKAVQIRTEEEEEKDKRLYKKKARNFKKKYQILNSLKEEQEEQEDQGGSRRGKQRKRPRPDEDSGHHEQAGTSASSSSREREGPQGEEKESDLAAAGEIAEEPEDCTTGSVGATGGKSKTKVKRKKRAATNGAGNGLPTSTAKKLKRKKSKKQKISSAAAKKLSSARLKSYGL